VSGFKKFLLSLFLYLIKERKYRILGKPKRLKEIDKNERNKNKINRG
jgi:hypothetical protein